jgi:hypothetical protein
MGKNESVETNTMPQRILQEVLMLQNLVLKMADKQDLFGEADGESAGDRG